MGKDFWRMFLRMNWKFLWPASMGAFGEDAKEAADEVSEETGPVALVILVIVLIGCIVWLIFK